MNRRKTGQAPADRGRFEFTGLAIFQIGGVAGLGRRQARSGAPGAELGLAGKIIGQRLDAGVGSRLETLAEREAIDRCVGGDKVAQQCGEWHDAVDGTPTRSLLDGALAGRPNNYQFDAGLRDGALKGLVGRHGVIVSMNDRGGRTKRHSSEVYPLLTPHQQAYPRSFKRPSKHVDRKATFSL